jgi:hypothetical protein
VIERTERARTGPRRGRAAERPGAHGRTLAGAAATALAFALVAAGLAQAPPSFGASSEASFGAPVVEASVGPLPAPAVTLAPYRGGVAALLRDGRLLHVTGGGTRLLTRGLDGEVLAVCDDRLLAIDAATGRLIRVGGRFGPPVSLHATPLCLPDGRVLAVDPDGRRLLRLDETLRVEASVALTVLPDAEPTALADGSVAVPSDPTLRYRHGVLGDEVEAAAATVIEPSTLAPRAHWTATSDVVIEERRLLPFPAADRGGLVATLSGGGDGGAIAVLAYGRADAARELRVVARAPGLGRERRWRHVLGASGPRIYTVATPHVGGPLERFTFTRTPDGARLAREAYDLPVTSHRIGRRELDLGRLLPRAPADAADLDLLLLPGRDLASLRLIACDRSGCAVASSVELPAPLAAAPWAERTDGAGVHVWAADAAGGLTRVRFPRDGIPSVSE